VILASTKGSGAKHRVHLAVSILPECTQRRSYKSPAEVL
jgi:hypothetical protein